jgi:hypothetical protein
MPLPHDCVLADVRRPSIILRFLHGDDHVQRVALGAKTAELEWFHGEVAAGRTKAQTAADQLNVTVATVRRMLPRYYCKYRRRLPSLAPITGREEPLTTARNSEQPLTTAPGIPVNRVYHPIHRPFGNKPRRCSCRKPRCFLL